MGNQANQPHRKQKQQIKQRQKQFIKSQKEKMHQSWLKWVKNPVTKVGKKLLKD